MRAFIDACVLCVVCCRSVAMDDRSFREFFAALSSVDVHAASPPSSSSSLTQVGDMSLHAARDTYAQLTHNMPCVSVAGVNALRAHIDAHIAACTLSSSFFRVTPLLLDNLHTLTNAAIQNRATHILSPPTNNNTNTTLDDNTRTVDSLLSHDDDAAVKTSSHSVDLHMNDALADLSATILIALMPALLHAKPTRIRSHLTHMHTTTPSNIVPPDIDAFTLHNNVNSDSAHEPRMHEHADDDTIHDPDPDDFVFEADPHSDDDDHDTHAHTHTITDTDDEKTNITTHACIPSTCDNDDDDECDEAVWSECESMLMLLFDHYRYSLFSSSHVWKQHDLHTQLMHILSMLSEHAYMFNDDKVRAARLRVYACQS